MPNAFEELCKLASDENWCWNIYCTTCGHLHFKYAFAEIANDKSPTDADWLIHSNITNYTQKLGSVPRNFTEKQKQKVLEICQYANLSNIATECKFPDWLGFLGLVLHHFGGDTKDNKTLSSSWASQLKNLVPPFSQSYVNLESICSTNSKFLSLNDLENCELDIQQFG